MKNFFIKTFFFLFLVASTTVYGVTITVTNTNDSGAGSLRQAITDASAGDTIEFSVSGTITLSSSLTISKNLTIQGPGASSLDISGNNSVRVFLVSGSAVVTINDLSIINGTASNYGGGVENDQATTTINNCKITGCTVTGTGTGAGVDSYNGTVTINNSLLSGNTAGGRGGAVSAYGGSMTLNNSTLDSNNADMGGAIGQLQSTGDLTVTGCTISNNSANQGQNYGGGIYWYNGTVNITNTTFSGNSASYGGAISDGSAAYTMNINACTIVNNSASTQGGGILLRNATANIKNTILASNTCATGANYYSDGGTLTSQGYNLCDVALTAFTGTGDIQNGTLNIDVLADNGGSTNTHALLSGSDAIDAIPAANSYNGIPVTDQIGTSRPQGINADIGAYEKTVTVALSVTTQAVTSVTATTATGNGNITSLGASSPTAHGVCWNTTGNPKTVDDCTDEGSATILGTFSSEMTGLSENMTYYVRAYATNNEGTSYGNEFIFTTQPSAPQPNYALTFDGTDDYVTANGVCNTIASEFTIETWFNTDDVTGSGNNQSIWAINDGDGIQNLLVLGLGSEGKIAVWHYNGTSNTRLFTGTSTLENNQWYHIALTVGGGTLTVYLNGKEEWTGAKTITVGNTDLFSIGQEWDNTTASEFFNGKIDEFRIWNDIRTKTEIRQNMYRELPDPASETNLTAYYKFNETAGTTLRDSKNSNTGTLTNMTGVEWIPSNAMSGPKKALDLDGNNDYVFANLNSSGSSAITIESYIYFNNLTNQQNIIHIDDGGANLRIVPYKSADNKISLFVANSLNQGDVLSSDFTLEVNKWYHFAFVYDNRYSAIYVNGKKVAEKTVAYSYSLDGTDRLYLGADWGTGFPSNIKIDEVRIWNTARTTSEIRENMMHHLTGNETGLIAYYNFDNTSGTILQDFSENENDATLMNMDNTDWVDSEAYNTWLGAAGSDWSEALNWSDGVPTSIDNVGIYKWPGNSEVSISGTPEVNNILISSTSTPTLDSNITVNGHLLLEKDMNLNGKTVTIGIAGTLVEETGIFSGTSGEITTTRNLSSITSENVGGLGAIITTAANMGSTTITRKHTSLSGGMLDGSILRSYDISPANNSGLGATLVFSYLDGELNDLTESSLTLFKSTDSGTTWTNESGTVDTQYKTVTLAGIDGFSLWTAGKAVATPTVTTGSATSVVSDSAVLNGTVNANDNSTMVTFEYGLSTEYGTTATADESPVIGTEEISVSKTITGLSPNTTYHYRVVGTNGGGTVNGTDMTFTTLKATPTITTAPTATAITYGEALSASTLSGGVATTAGTFAFTDDSITPDAETYTAGVTFTPTDTTNYNTATTTINVTVNKAAPVITWGNPSDITYGTALSGNELNAEANVTGTFEYTPAINTILESGFSQSLSVTFTPGDTTNYTTETKTVSINVSPAEITAKADDKTRNYGEANPAFTITYSGFVNGEDETAVTTASTAVTTATANSPAGTYDITVSGGTAPNYTFTYTKGTLTINGIIPTATTGTASTLTTRQATLNGTVADNGGNTVTEKGICISTSANPTTADTCMTDTSEESVIIGTFTGLTPNTTYHYRAYATTLEGTGYGNDQTFITYKAVTITTGQSFSVNENEPALTAVGTIEITGDIQGTANYTITAGNTENIFQMSGAEIQVADATKLDYETAVSHTVTIKIEDDENTSEETVTINLTNLNDNTPVITDSQYTLSENALNGTVIATLSAADADGTLNELTYTIETGNNDGIFTLNPTTGELTVIDNTNLDYETTASYSLGIKVSDTENEATATVTITITDETGTCAEPTEIDTLPFTVDTTTAERYSNITNYGANCGETTYGENDHTYVYTVSAGDKIEITATPETDYDLILMIQSDCGSNCDTYANEGTAGTAETIIYEATENKDIYIIVEGINGSGTYTLDVKVKVEETPDEDELTDDDEIIDEETDEDIYPVDEDEITDDDATSTDEDEVIDEENDDDIYPADEDEITDDDATSTDEDEVIDEETDEDIYPADEDEVTDTETDNDVTEVIDEENDEESDTEETDSDIVKPSSDDGCGCSVIAW